MRKFWIDVGHRRKEHLRSRAAPRRGENAFARFDADAVGTKQISSHQLLLVLFLARLKIKKER
jgi:hypothetical protein